MATCHIQDRYRQFDMLNKILALLTLFSLYGCSYLTDFYIINASDNTIFVEYKVEDFDLLGPFVSDPYITTMDKNFEHNQEEITETIIRDIKNKTIKCELNPGQSLWLGDDINFNIKSQSDRTKLEKKIVYLKIEIPEGVLSANKSNIVSSLEVFDIHHVGIEIE